MEKIIQDKIQNLEKEHGIKIVFALESGSRAWGFPSLDSDYDVRFIYVRTLNEYLSINAKDDFLEFPINSDLDLNGWDLKKFLKLLYASNATPFEWMQSPIFYKKEDDFFISILENLSDFYCQQTLMHHYLGLTKKKLFDLNVHAIKLKTLFYILRSLLAAKYCYVKNEFPPMELDKLLFLIENDKVLQEITFLRIEKLNVTESFTTSISSELFSYLKKMDEELSHAKKTKTKGVGFPFLVQVKIIQYNT